MTQKCHYFFLLCFDIHESILIIIDRISTQKVSGEKMLRFHASPN